MEEHGLLQTRAVESELSALREQVTSLKKVAFVSLAVAAVAVGAVLLPGSSGPALTPGRAPATTQLWAGADRVVVPKGFDGCDTAGWPAQIAPVRRAGDFVYLSGILGYAEPCKSAEQDPMKQVQLAFKWMDETLATAGVTWKDVLSVTSYHVQMEQHEDKFFEQRLEYMPSGPYPSWSAVQVSKLFFPGQVLELSAVARIPPCENLEC